MKHLLLTLNKRDRTFKGNAKPGRDSDQVGACLGHLLRVVDGLWADNIDFAMLHRIFGVDRTSTQARS